MDAQMTAVARRCLEAGYDGTMSFPASVGTLMQAGFEAYMVDYRRNTRTHYLPDGKTVLIDNPHDDGPVAERFDKDDVAAAIRWAQSGAADYTYADFNRRVTAAGCAFYLVSFPGRRVVYVGRSGDMHVEHFPQQGV